MAFGKCPSQAPLRVTDPRYSCARAQAGSRELKASWGVFLHLSVALMPGLAPIQSAAVPNPPTTLGALVDSALSLHRLSANENTGEQSRQSHRLLQIAASQTAEQRAGRRCSDSLYQDRSRGLSRVDARDYASTQTCGGRGTLSLMGTKG